MRPRKLTFFLAGCGKLEQAAQRSFYSLAERKLNLLGIEAINPCNIPKGFEMSEFVGKANALFLCHELWSFDKLATDCLQFAAKNNYKIYLDNQYDIIVREFADKIIC